MADVAMQVRILPTSDKKSKKEKHMKTKLISILLLLSLCIGCNQSQSPMIITMSDPLENAYEIKFNYKEDYKRQVRNNIDFFLKKHKRKWNEQDIDKLMTALIIGQQEFNINYKAVLAIISIESNFKINAVGKNKGSEDYGLTQQNSLYYEMRYKSAEKYLDEYGIQYTSSKFDISKNVISCYAFLNELRRSEHTTNLYEIIDAYNKGIRGMKRSNCMKYYVKFSKEFFNI